MKLTLEIDLDPLREAAARQIDAVFETRARDVSACPTIHAVKARVARSMTPNNDKATAVALAAILAKAAAADRAVLALDAQRRAAKQRLAAATSEQAIAALLIEIGA